jgi:type I restriction enzyme, R subunit
VIIMKPYEDYAVKFNEAYQKLLELVPSVDAVNELRTEDEELEFIKAFRELMRIRNTMTAFADFSWSDLEMEEQEFEDYKSKYLDLHDKVRIEHEKDKVSILEDVDFELELLHRDDINVAYILQLLMKLKTDNKKDAVKTEADILNILSGDSDLRSKRELIERFIKENLPIIEDSETIPQEFDKFWSEEQVKAFNKIVTEENLSPERTEQLIENYLFSEQEPLRDEVLDLIEGTKPTILERKKTGDRILDKIVTFVKTFVSGITG